MQCANEIWLPVPGYEGLYEVSNFGKVKSFARKGTKGQHLKKYSEVSGYERVNLCINGASSHVMVHRLVAEAFVPNPENKPQVNHIDGNKRNNLASNLEWVSNSENQLHARQIGLNRAYKNNPTHSKSVDMFSLDGTFIKTFPSMKEAFRQTGIMGGNIAKCCSNKYGCKTAGGYVWKYHSGGDS